MTPFGKGLDAEMGGARKGREALGLKSGLLVGKKEKGARGPRNAARPSLRRSLSSVVVGLCGASEFMSAQRAGIADT